MAQPKENKPESNIHQHTAKFRQKATDLGHEAQDLAKISKDIANDTVQYLRENAEGYYSQGMEKAKNLEKNLESKVKENPLQSLLIAAGLGMLVGWLFKRK